MILLLATILPSILIILFFVLSDKFKEPNAEIIKVFFYGILITIPAFFINTYLSGIWASTQMDEGLKSSFFTAAPVEEGLKLAVLYFLVYKMKDFNEPIDGIVYGVAVSLGFATLENFYYVYILADYYETTPIYMAFLRSFSAVPAHGIFGVFMGYFFMRYAFIKKGDNLIFAFLVPFTLHGCYNLFTTSNFYISLILIIVSWIVALKMFSKLKKIQSKKKKKMRKKLFNILLKLKIIVIFLLMSNINTALSNCETFSNDLAQLNYKFTGAVEFNNFGFDLMEKYNENSKSWEPAKENGNFQVGRIYDTKLLKFFKTGDQILKANQKNFNPEILYENDTIEFEILNKEEIIKKKITKSKYTTFNPTLDIKYLDFNKIDTKNGIVEFSMKYDIFSMHLSEGHPKLWNAVEENIIFKLDDGSYTYYICDYTQKQFNDLKLYPPEKGFKILNQVKSDKDLVDNKTYELAPYSPKIGNPDEYLFISSELGGTYSIKNKFNLKTFPFDKQTVRIKIVDDFQKIPNTVLFESGLSLLSLSNIKDNNDIPGWNIKSFDFNILNYQNPFFMEDDYATGIELSMVIERKHSYYLYKVILPIVLILLVCWLVVWIDPKELEARLTVTIVCLLSLIAYNFVIDSELPKLEYLTVLDWIILTSYIYAVIPNILSVVSFRLLKTNQLLGNNIEKLSTRYGVLSYFLIILLIILINANINPNNSTAIISWMALR